MGFWGKMTGSEKQSTSYDGYGGNKNTPAAPAADAGAGRGDQSANAEKVRKANAAAALLAKQTKDKADAKVKADKIASDKAIYDKKVADKKAADKVIADKKAADKKAADKVIADAKVIADKKAADKVIADKKAKDKADAKAKADKVIADKKALDKLVAEEDKAATAAAALLKSNTNSSTNNSKDEDSPYSFGDTFATIENAPLPVFEDMAPVSSSLPSESTFGSFHGKITTHIPEAEPVHVNGVLVEESIGQDSDGNKGFTDEEIMANLSDPEEKTVMGIMDLLKIQDPEAGVASRLGRALEIRATTAPVDFFLDNIGILLNPVAGLLTNLASEPLQRAFDGRSEEGSLLADVGNTVMENPGTILAATVEGGAMIGGMLQLGIDMNNGKTPENSIGDLMAGPLLGPMIGSAVSGINPFDNPYLNMATQIGLTVAGVNIGASLIDKAANAPSSVDYGSGSRSLLADTSGQGDQNNNAFQPTVAANAGASQFTSPFSPDSTDILPISYKGGFRGMSEDEEDDTLFANPFSKTVSRKERNTISGTAAFDPSMQQTNILGFGTGQMLSLEDDPNDQFTTRQRTSGGRFEEDTVSFLPQRTV
jgi:hypothetical protein